MNVSETQKPPIGGMGGSIHDWERGIDPFGTDAGWIAVDAWGNQIAFCADGTEIAGVYDSEKDTLEHIFNVRGFLWKAVDAINRRANAHDKSKLEEPEKSMYDKYIPKIRETEKEFGYGSPQYEQCVKDMGVVMRHHFDANRHHPEHFENGVNGMTLIDLVEMLADWKAASQKSGQPLNLEANRKRFDISDQLFEILQNTAKEMGWT